MPHDLFGQYDVVHVVARGAASIVYQVTDPKTEEVFALKVVRPRCRPDRRFLMQLRNEFAVSRQLDHPSLVRIHEYVERKRLFWAHKAGLLMEWVNGRPIDPSDKLGVGHLVSVFYQVARAMRYMHSRGVLHGDLKPGNMMLQPGGAVKLIDFGLCRRRGSDTLRVQGTLDYIAPEQAASGTMTQRTDIYNLGATMYKLLSERTLPSTVDLGAVEEGYIPVKRPPDPPSRHRAGIPDRLDRLVMQCCEVDPKDRPQNMGLVVAELTALAKQMGVSIK